MYSQEYQKTLIQNHIQKLEFPSEHRDGYPINCNIPKNTVLAKLDFFNITTPLLNVNIRKNIFKCDNKNPRIETIQDTYKFDNNFPTIDNLNIKKDEAATINLLFDDPTPPVIKHMAATIDYSPCECCGQDRVVELDVEFDGETDIFEENDKHKLDYYYKSYIYTFNLPTIVAHYVYTETSDAVDAK